MKERAMNLRKQRGVAVIEFALVLPMLLVMTFVVTEFGRAIYQYNILAKSVRDAARYLSVQTPNTHVAQAQNLVVYGNTTGTGSPLALGLATSQVSASWPAATGTNPAISMVTVQITGYSFQSVFTTAFGLSFGTVPYTSIQASMRSSTS
jgi:Flp pilus assembly protein TadG